MRLLDHSFDVHSQGGEDGIIARILDLLPAKDGWCVEFGAWDGKFLSNTRNLIESRNYAAVLIEADPRRFQDLVRGNAANPRVVPLNRFVGFSAEDKLDVVLAGLPVPLDFDFLSIDVDGNDYHVWAAVTRYAPKVVCIEFNPTIPTGLEFVQLADPAVSHGSSLLSLTRLAQRLGYELVAVTQTNALFVRAEFFGLFAIADNSPEKLREDTSPVVHLFSGYDGTLFLEGRSTLPWHGVTYQSRIRQLPRFFRKYPGNFGRLRGRLWRFYVWLLGA